MNTGELTVGQLKRILRTATDEATIPEAIEALAEADRRETADLEHGARVTAYNEYIARRREREHEAVQGAFTAAKEAVIAARPISPEGAYMVGKEAADTERLRFEVRAPLLTFEGWLAEGEPEIHETPPVFLDKHAPTPQQLSARIGSSRGNLVQREPFLPDARHRSRHP